MTLLDPWTVPLARRTETLGLLTASPAHRLPCWCRRSLPLHSCPAHPGLAYLRSGSETCGGLAKEAIRS